MCLRKTIAKGCLIAGLLLAPFSAQAAEHEVDHIRLVVDPNLTLGGVVQAAVAQAPDRLVATARANASRAYARKSSSLFAGTPQLWVNHQTDGPMTAQGLREWESRVEVPIWVPGEKSAYRRKASAAKAGAQAYQNRLTWNVARDVRELLWKVKLTEAALNESRSALTIAEKLQHDVQRRIDTGDLPRNSLLLAKQEVAARQIDLKGAERDYVDTAVSYLSYTGLRTIPASIEEQRREVEDEFAVPNLLYAQRMVDFYRAELSAARHSWSRSPTVSLGVKHERGMYGQEPIDSLGVSLTVPLGGGAEMAPKRAEAAEKLAEALRQQELEIRRQKIALHEAEHELEVCLAQQKIAGEHYAMARENLRLARRAFELGESDLMDLLRVQEQYFQSSNAHTRWGLECGLKTARYNQTKGILPQ